MRSWMMAAVVAVAVAAPAMAADWVTVRDSEAGFTLRLPGEPKVTRGPAAKEAGGHPQVQYELEAADGSYLVTAVQFGATLNEQQLTGALDSTVTAAASANGNVETARRTIRVGGVQGRDVEFKNGTQRGWLRVFYKNGWLCTMVVTQVATMSPVGPSQAVTSFVPL